MKAATHILSAIWSICLFILVIYLALIPTIFSRSFCETQFHNNNTYQRLNLSEEELNKAIDKTLDYLYGNTDDLHFEVTMEDGTVREFYEVTTDSYYPYEVHDEYAHMEEVRNIFLTSKSIAFLALIVLIASSILLWTQRKVSGKGIFRTIYITLGVLLGLCIIVGLYAAIDFDSFFVTFHHIFFPGGNWTFNYNSLMLNMFESLLFGILYQGVLIFVGLSLVSISLIVVLQKEITKQK